MENTTNLSLPKEKLERDPVKTVILASMMGTAIEFFDFYAYGTASAAYFPSVFFPQTTPLLATLLSLLSLLSRVRSDRFYSDTSAIDWEERKRWSFRCW